MEGKGVRWLALAAALLLALSAARPAAAAPGMRLGLMDDALLTNRPDLAWPWIAQLEPRVIRFDVDWAMIARRRPLAPRNDLDPAYRWGGVDDVVVRAHRAGIEL